MQKYGKLEWLFTFVVLLGIIYGSYTLSRRIITEPAETDALKMSMTEVILDAGHGGSDPGKIGINGVPEKEINLAIVRKIQKYLEEEGITVALTREEDARLNEWGQEYTKSEDMRARVEMINELKPQIAVSIHQNSYPSEEVKGAQVFYYEGSEVSEKMAGIIQEAMRKVDPSNDRQIKANDTYYMLRHTEVVTLIVECGFLTNWEEADKLTEEAYQEEMAKAIAEGIMECLGKNKIAASSI